MRIPNYQGLRTFTPDEISAEIQKLRNLGHKVRHKTHYVGGKKLPFNGVLVINE